MASEVAALSDGRRVRFSLLKRKNRPAYFAFFRGPDGRRREKSTLEKNRKRAQDAAVAIIREAYHQQGFTPTWEDALDALADHERAANLRSKSTDQYRFAIRALRRLFPDTGGPSDFTAEMAEAFKLARSKEVLPRTLEGNIDNLRISWNHWCRLLKLSSNPFNGVEPPRYEESPNRYVEQKELDELLDWIGLEIPCLFLETAAAVGSRIGELSQVQSDGLEDGRIRFVAETTKGRKERRPLLPLDLFRRIQEIVGPVWVWERAPDELRAAKPRYASRIKDYHPARFARWLQDQAADYFKATGAPEFKIHNLRGHAISRAKMAGVAPKDAALAFGVNPATARAHYEAIDEMAVTDSVFRRIQSAGAGRAQSVNQ